MIEMTVLNIATTKVLSSEKMTAYIKAASPLLDRYGVEVVLRGKFIKGVHSEPHIVGIFRFRNMETADDFYSCDEYIKLLPLRDAAGDMTFNFYDE